MPTKGNDPRMQPDTKRYQDADWLRAEIEDKGRTAQEIAREFDVTKQNVMYFMRQFGIRSRNPAHTRRNVYRGEDNPRWKGGVQKYAPDWEELREKAKAAAGYACQECGAHPDKPNKLQAHHIDGNRLNNDPSNIRVLCRSCHNRVHHIGSWNRKNKEGSMPPA